MGGTTLENRENYSQIPLPYQHGKIKFMGVKVVARNRKARHDYFLLDTYEAGISLQGSEIKSIRAGQVSIKEAYVRVNGDEAWLVDAHIAPYSLANRFNHEPKRPRKLLLHKKEIHRLYEDVRRKGVTIIPTQIYLKDGRAKVEIATARGKKKYDKRQAIAKRDAQREVNRQLFRKDS
jgi:SsrA-binding protein